MDKVITESEETPDIDVRITELTLADGKLWEGFFAACREYAALARQRQLAQAGTNLDAQSHPETPDAEIPCTMGSTDGPLPGNKRAA